MSAPKRPAHPLPPAPRLPRQRPTRVDLGTYRFGGEEFEAELVVSAPRCADMARRAAKSRDGRAVAIGGGITVIARRKKPPPAAEASTAASPPTAPPGAAR